MYIIECLDVDSCREKSAQAFRRIIENKKQFLDSDCEQIIQKVMPESKCCNWQYSKANQDILASIGLLISRVNRNDSNLCLELLKNVLKKLIDPFQEKMMWIETE